MKDPKFMTEREKKEGLRELYGALGVELTDEQLNAWSDMQSMEITGATKAKTVEVSIDLLFAVFQVLDQMSVEITKDETEKGRLPFDGSCSCPKHTWMIPAYNEIGRILNEKTVGKKDLSIEFQYGLQMMQEKQHKMMLEHSERIQGTKKEEVN
jgi:hypothetical protein